MSHVESLGFGFKYFRLKKYSIFFFLSYLRLFKFSIVDLSNKTHWWGLLITGKQLKSLVWRGHKNTLRHNTLCEVGHKTVRPWVKHQVVSVKQKGPRSWRKKWRQEEWRKRAFQCDRKSFIIIFRFLLFSPFDWSFNMSLFPRVFTSFVSVTSYIQGIISDRSYSVLHSRWSESNEDTQETPPCCYH